MTRIFLLLLLAATVALCWIAVELHWGNAIADTRLSLDTYEIQRLRRELAETQRVAKLDRDQAALRIVEMRAYLRFIGHERRFFTWVSKPRE